MRILAGVGAWLLGAGTATAGSLLAVSLLGQGIADSPGQQLTTAAVNRALARETQDASDARHADSAASPVRTSPVTQSRRDPARRDPAGPGGAHAVRHACRLPGGRRLAEPAGGGRHRAHVAGRDRAGRVPAGGRLPGVVEPDPGLRGRRSVARGPAATARVVFESDANSVTMVVSCPDGTAGPPVASSYVRSWGGGSDE